MKILNYFKALTKFEWVLWIFSLVAVSVSFILCPEKDYLSLSASLIGATALIFVAKGMVFGQFLTVVFAAFYGIISFYFKYYGEMITYVFMSAPAAVFSIISWLRHPYEKSDEVEIAKKLSLKSKVLLSLFTLTLTVAFYFILGAFGTANLVFSTLSVSTSFLASSLTFLRSPYYAVAYALNDIVLIILWILAAAVNIAYLPMILCFVVFLFNDVYGFVNWNRIKKRQN